MLREAGCGFFTAKNKSGGKAPHSKSGFFGLRRFAAAFFHLRP